MKITRSSTFSDVIVIEPKIFKDNRGHFLETYQAQRYLENGISEKFLQDNLSYSGKGTLRGLHYQLGRPQGKVVFVILGEVFDVSVDIRRGSPTFGQWVGLTLSSKNYRQVYIPEGFAHGFCVTSEPAIFAYKCTDYYTAEEEHGIRWDDPSLGIDWPLENPLLFDKDRQYPYLRNMPPDYLPVYDKKVLFTWI